MGRLDHTHIRVPDRASAVAWYAEHLGFEPVDAYDFWATGIEGGPVQISADGGATTLAIFEASEDGHPMIPQVNGIAFSVDADTFAAFVRSLPGAIQGPLGRPVLASDVVDFDLCWAIDLMDPWGNRYELNCYDYDAVQRELVEADAVTPTRYWPAGLHEAYETARHGAGSGETSR